VAELEDVISEMGQANAELGAEKEQLRRALPTTELLSSDLRNKVCTCTLRVEHPLYPSLPGPAHTAAPSPQEGEGGLVDGLARTRLCDVRAADLTVRLSPICMSGGPS